MENNLFRDVVQVVFASVIVVAMVFGAMKLSERLRMSNNGRVAVQFVYEQLNICHEKLAAYGEDVELDVPMHKVTSEALNTCLEKLGAYGDNATLPMTKE